VLPISAAADNQTSHSDQSYGPDNYKQPSVTATSAFHGTTFGGGIPAMMAPMLASAGFPSSQ